MVGHTRTSGGPPPSRGSIRAQGHQKSGLYRLVHHSVYTKVKVDELKWSKSKSNDSDTDDEGEGGRYIRCLIDYQGDKPQRLEDLTHAFHGCAPSMRSVTSPTPGLPPTASASPSATTLMSACSVGQAPQTYLSS
ncbi:hypothetical protein BGZ73_001776, partial [Actinomortierella ambigua]